MLAPTASPPFTPLPGEQILFTPPPRIGFSLSTPSHYPDKKQPPYSLTHASGVLYLTTRRILYLPDKGTDKLQSFAAPILNLHDSHVTAPFFGPNVWTALLQPVQGGGIPVPDTGVVELKLTFKEGGCYDWHTKFEQVKERLHQAVEANGGAPSSAAGASAQNAVMEDLPAYQEESDGPLLSPVVGAGAAASASAPAQTRDSGIGVEYDRPRAKPADGFEAPSEPPPGYEEAQEAAIRDEVERRLSGSRH